MAGLTYKQKLFVSFYLGESKGNALDAARRAGYAWPEKVASRLVGKSGIRAAIDAKLDEAALTSSEILARLSGHATADIGDFLKVDANGGHKLDLAKAKKRGKLHLIKKLRPTKFGTAIELHDPQAALVQLGKYRKLFVDQVDHSIDLAHLDEQFRASLRKCYGDADAAGPVHEGGE